MPSEISSTGQYVYLWPAVTVVPWVFLVFDKINKKVNIECMCAQAKHCPGLLIPKFRLCQQKKETQSTKQLVFSKNNVILQHSSNSEERYRHVYYIIAVITTGCNSQLL